MSRDEVNQLDRRQFNKLAAATALSAAMAGCSTDSSADRPPQKVWGSLGGGKGQFSKPRAIAIDKEDQLYIVDMTSRIQVFDTDGNSIRSWQTPEQQTGRPACLRIGPIKCNLMADGPHT